MAIYAPSLRRQSVHERYPTFVAFYWNLRPGVVLPLRGPFLFKHFFIVSRGVIREIFSSGTAPAISEK